VEGDGWRFDVHQRVQVRVTSEPAGTAAVGFGVGAAPDRLVDLRLDLVDRPRVQAWHDIDRLAVVASAGGVDFTVGRQAITWGGSMLFPVADLWAAFSPFEQETEEKPGIDAVRALFYPRAGLEMDVVVAHRGSARDLSAGIRGTLAGTHADVWLGGGRFWRQLMAMGGVTVLLEQSRLRGEVVLPWSADDDVAAGTTRGFQRPRITLGAERLGGTWMVGAEYHHNGIGRADADRYVEAAGPAAAARRELLRRPPLRRRPRHVEPRRAEPAEPRAHGTGQPRRSQRGVHAQRHVRPRPGHAPVGGRAAVRGSRPAFSLLPPFVRPRSEFGLYGNALFTTISVFFSDGATPIRYTRYRTRCRMFSFSRSRASASSMEDPSPRSISAAASFKAATVSSSSSRSSSSW
jgi:hypothetical protein